MRTLCALLFCLFCFGAVSSEDVGKIGAPAEDRPLIQMAILLDTSGSMEGLIDQAKAQLWRIVNEFITAKRAGKKPVVQVALYRYGTPSLGAETGYIRQLVPLTTDLDKVSQELFALRTDGGDEYCGWVIKTATEQLEWSKSNKDLKVIFICGNEPFTQGPVDYKKSCKAAIEKGIVVNTIHCGPEAEGISGMWKDGAVIADGQYSIIDQNKALVSINAPQDKEIAKLNEELNKTYVAYGAHGQEAAANQAVQDGNAAKLGLEAYNQRAACKASGNYTNGHWDLVDAYKADAKKLETVKVEELPAELQKLKPEERKAFVEEKSKARAEIQEKIAKLNTERVQYVTEERKKQAAAGKDASLDEAIVKTIRTQAEKKEFAF